MGALVNRNIAVVLRTRAIAVRLNIPLGGAFAKLKPSHPKEVSSYPSAGGIYRICQSEEVDMSFWIRDGESRRTGSTWRVGGPTRLESDTMIVHISLDILAGISS